MAKSRRKSTSPLYPCSNPLVDRISVIFKEADVGDKIVCGNLEAFSFSPETKEDDDGPKPKRPRLDEDIISPDFLIELGRALNRTYPDFSFPERADAFQVETDFATICAQVNHVIALTIERVVPGFLRELWAAVADTVDLRTSAVISLRSSQLSGLAALQCAADANGGAVTAAIDFFFTDLGRGRVVYLTFAARPSHLSLDEATTTPDMTSSEVSLAAEGYSNDASDEDEAEEEEEEE